MSNLKKIKQPFSIYWAKKGVKVITRDWREVEIVTYEAKINNDSIVARVNYDVRNEDDPKDKYFSSYLNYYDENGYSRNNNSDDDLFLCYEYDVQNEKIKYFNEKVGRFEYCDTLTFNLHNNVNGPLKEYIEYANFKVGPSIYEGDISVEGGSSNAYAFVYYEYRKVQKWNNDEIRYDGWKRSAQRIEGNKIYADKVWYDYKKRTLIGISTPFGVVHGEKCTGTPVEIYQEEKKENIQE